jgi:hypothetical protein
LGSVEPLEGEQVVPLVIQSGFPEVGDQVPVADEVDGVLQRLLDCRPLTAGERAVERIARALAFDDGDDRPVLPRRRKPPQGSVGELPIHLDQGLPL